MSELPESAAKVTRKEEIPADFPLSRFFALPQRRLAYVFLR